MKRTSLIALAAAMALTLSPTEANGAKRKGAVQKNSHSADTSANVSPQHHEANPGSIVRLTEEDYRDVAARLGVEVATIKAVVEIEAGPSHEGFFKAGLPLINFDMSMYRKFAGKKGINLSKYYKSHAVVFARPSASRYGSTQAAQQERLRVARTIDNATAIQGCFWGMFQIGGFNWRKCGCSTIDEFVERMSRSEREQLELFADFMINTGMVQHLKTKNWSAFARSYNGPSYASRGYHTRLANSYAKHLRSR